MPNSLRIALAQLNFLVGDIEGNAAKIIRTALNARDQHADIVVFPELTLTGYPPEDLLFRDDLYQRIDAALSNICAQTVGIDVVVGHPVKTATGCYNRISFIRNGAIVTHGDKQNLPNYSVFDEVRYFKPGPAKACIVDVKGVSVGLVVCEDLWYPEPITQTKAAGAQLAIAINASPFAKDKATWRHSIIKQRIQESGLPIVYVNCVGGQDELVFDGGSMVFDQHGQLTQQAAFFQEEVSICNIELPTVSPQHVALPAALSEEARIYQALVLGLRDYIEKNHFPRAVLGLSGGIDSALTLAIAVDAIGKDRVTAVMMPSRYTGSLSLSAAEKQAIAMGVDYHVLPIEPLFNTFLTTLDPVFHGLPADVTEENLQARCRGTLLMALSNKTKAIVLATGNKSEMAVGYCTLYGDMVGGFCVLKDVFKTMVYRLAHYRNSISPIIPQEVIERAPSAELAPNQLDQDSLPPYDVLDAILNGYIEQDKSLQDLVTMGFDEAVVQRVMKLVDCNEYKRRQAAPGIRITERAFGKDRRYPITSGFKPFGRP